MFFLLVCCFSTMKESSNSFSLLSCGFCGLSCLCSCVFRTVSSKRVGQGQLFQCFGVNPQHCLLEQSLALSQFPRLAPNAHLSKDLGLAPKQMLLYFTTFTLFCVCLDWFVLGLIRHSDVM